MFAFARKAATLRRYLRFLPPQALLPIGIAGLSFLIDLETPDDIADGFFNARSARERELAISQLEQLHAAAERAVNAERVKLSRWLHEGLAQELAAVGWAGARPPCDGRSKSAVGSGRT